MEYVIKYVLFLFYFQVFVLLRNLLKNQHNTSKLLFLNAFVNKREKCK